MPYLVVLTRNRFHISLSLLYDLNMLEHDLVAES